MQRTVIVLATLLLGLLPGAPASAADNGLTVLAAPPASGGRMRLQVEVTEPSLQRELRASASPARFRVVAEQAGAQVTAVHRMADGREGRYTVLAFDQSKSFSAHWAQAFALARDWSDALGPRAQRHSVAVMTFGKSKATHCEETSSAGLNACLDKVERLGTHQLVTRLRFYIQDAVREAARQQPLARGGSREVIVFTDAGEESTALNLKKLASDARELGVRVHVVVFSGKGTGKGLARRLDEMSQLAAGSGGRYIQVEDVDASKAVAGLVGALEHLYWLEVAFCGVKPGTRSDRLSVEALSNGARTAWSDSLSFRQSAEGQATAACSQPSQPATTTAQPGSTPGSPGTGTSGGTSQPGGVTGTPGAGTSPGGSAPAQASSGLPWWLIALLLLLVLGVIIFLLTRRRSEPAPAPILEAPPVVAPPPAVEPPPEPAPAPAPVWRDPFATLPETRLVVSKGPPGLEPFYRVHKSSFTIGARSGEMDLAVDVPQLSGHHVTVQLFKAGNVFVKDEGSTNGTFVDGRRLGPGERVPLKPGQKLRLSQHLELTLEQPGLQPDLPPADGVSLVAAPAVSAAQPPAESPRAKARTIYAPARSEEE